MMNPTLFSLVTAALLGVVHADVPFRYRFCMSPFHKDVIMLTGSRLNPKLQSQQPSYQHLATDQSRPVRHLPLTYPRMVLKVTSLSGKLGGCYSAPTGTDWQRVELDENFSGTRNGVLVFCDAQCQGRVTSLQRGSHCVTPVSGCAAGSL